MRRPIFLKGENNDGSKESRPGYCYDRLFILGHGYTIAFKHDRRTIFDLQAIGVISCYIMKTVLPRKTRSMVIHLGVYPDTMTDR